MGTNIGLTAFLLIALKGSVALLIFAVGLESRLKDLAYLQRRPGVMLRSLLAMYVVVPLLALIAVRLLRLPPGLELALVVLAISAGAPMLPRKLMRLGNEEYVISLVVVSSLMAIVTVPAWLLLLGPRFTSLDTLDPATVASVLGKSFLLPMLLGIAVRGFMPDVSARLSDMLLKVVGTVFSACAIGLLMTHWQVVGAILGPPILTLGGFTLAALCAGHLLGGPDPNDRTALAVTSATRHVGVAMVIAAATPGPRTVVLIVAYTLASALVIVPYMKWRGRATATGLQRAKR
jgi:bile acid:Na+ symporter, BASS family